MLTTEDTHLQTKIRRKKSFEWNVYAIRFGCVFIFLFLCTNHNFGSVQKLINVRKFFMERNTRLFSTAEEWKT